jgi:hypothetical protein
MNGTLMNVSKGECFFDTVGNLITRLQQSNTFYSNLCKLNDKLKIKRLILVSRIVGLIEANQNVPLNKSSSQFTEAIKSLDQFSDFKFSSYLMSIKEAITKGQNYSLIIKNLWSAMSDELDVISKNENYPFFFRQNIWTLIQVERSIIILKEHYAKGMNDCIPNNWEDIVNINDLTNDQNFMQIYRSHGGKTPADAYDVPVYSNAFENGGIALTFWGSENLNELAGKEKSVFVGYINNNRVYEYLLIPQNYTIVHRLKIFDVSIYLF